MLRNIWLKSQRGHLLPEGSVVFLILPEASRDSTYITQRPLFPSSFQIHPLSAILTSDAEKSASLTASYKNKQIKIFRNGRYRTMTKVERLNLRVP